MALVNGEDSAQVALRSLITQLEGDLTPRDEYDYYSAINELRKQLETENTLAPIDLRAELVAFMIHSHDGQSPSVWGSYFGPLMTSTSTDGQRLDSPPLSTISTEVLDYWRRRARECVHPVMRGRYADLLWELPPVAAGEKPEADMARLAVNSYLEAAEQGLYEHKILAINKSERALAIALALRDLELAKRAQDVMLILEEECEDDDSLGLWGFTFDAFVEPPNKSVGLDDEQKVKLLAALEARLERFAAREPSEYHPTGVEAAAIRLAKYYRRLGRADDLRRVMATYTGIVLTMRGTAPALVAGYSLERLYGQLKQFGLNAEANSINTHIRIVGEETRAAMHSTSVEIEIPSQQMEAHFTAMLAGSSNDVLFRLAAHYVPDRDELESQLREIAERSPLMFMFGRTIKDDDGRTIAEIGPLSEDLEGQLVVHISHNLHIAMPWLRETLRRASSSKVITSDSVEAFLFESPLFLENRRSQIGRGLLAYFEEDAIASIQVLVPQVEQAIRQLTNLIGAPIYTQRRGGGLHVRSLDDLLRDTAVVSILGTDVAAYLRLLLTDARGWNVRNIVTHGLASDGMLSMTVSDRVMHALLVLACYRTAKPNSQ